MTQGIYDQKLQFVNAHEAGEHAQNRAPGCFDGMTYYADENSLAWDWRDDLDLEPH